jgi:hypothetical protein
VVKQRVLPADPDIEHFVGYGVVEAVSVKGDKARVRHVGQKMEGGEGEHIRDYDIGHDLNFELKLYPGEDVHEFDHDEEAFNLDMEVISPARLMKVVKEFNPKHYMQHKQAMNLCIECVKHYYKEHSEDVNEDQLLQLMRKVRFRIKKIQDLIKDGSCQALSVSVVEDLPRLRKNMQKFYGNVDKERALMHAQIHQLETQIAELHEKLQSRHPSDAAQDIYDTVDVHHDEKPPSTVPSSEDSDALPMFLTGRRTGTERGLAAWVPVEPPRQDMATMMKSSAYNQDQREKTWDEDKDDEELLNDVETLLQETAAARARGIRGQKALKTGTRTCLEHDSQFIEPSAVSLASISIEDSESGFGSVRSSEFNEEQEIRMLARDRSPDGRSPSSSFRHESFRSRRT